MSKSYFDLSEKELARKSKLTKKEFDAINALKEAVRNLPRSICICVDESGVSISKRVTKNGAQEVARVRKSSLEF